MTQPPALRPLTLLALLLALALGACAALGVPTKAPSVRLVDLAPGGGGLFEQALFLDLRLTNPNREAITFDGMTFNLSVNGRPLAEGVSNQTVTVPGLGEAMTRVKASASTLHLARQLFSLPEEETLAYTIDGEVYLAGTALDLPLSYETSGEIDVMGTFRPGAPR